MISEIFSKVIQTPNYRFQKHRKHESDISKKSTASYIISKLKKDKDKETILNKTRGGKAHITYRGTKTTITSDVFSDIMQAGREKSKMCKVLKGKNRQ